MASGQEAITSYLRQMKFKRKVIGGVDEEDVLDKIEHITKLYKSLIEDLQSQVEQLQKSGKEQEERLSLLQIERNSVIQEREALTAKTQELVSVMQRNEREHVELVAQAEREAQKILMQARIQAENLAAQKEREIEQLTRRREVVENKLDDLILQIKATIRLIAGDLGQMQNLANGIEGKLDRYRDGNETKGV